MTSRYNSDFQSELYRDVTGYELMLHKVTLNRHQRNNEYEI